MDEGSSKKGLIWAVVAVLVVAVGAFLFFAAQNGDEEDAVETDATEVVEEEEFVPQESIVDVVVNNPDFSILAQAVEQAGLVDTLAGEGPFTVFAPNDEAFAALLEETGLTADELLADENLGNILTYHVIEGSVFAADVVGLDGEEVVTVNGQTILVSVDDEGNVFVNDAQVIVTDVETSNGVIHVINGVLQPTEE